MPSRSKAAQTWPADSAGSRMTTEVPTARADETVRQVLAALRRTARRNKGMQYVYVLDDARKLTGILSMHDLFSHAPAATVGKVCRRSGLQHVHPATHQERAAYIALKHGIKAVPVIDRDHVFLGAIHSDALLRILYKETHEDLLQRAGVHHGHPLFDNVLTLPLHTSVLHRLPWLILGLIGGVVAAQVVGAFERTLESNILLAAFIPLIVYMSSAVGTQTEVFIIRDLAMDRKIPFHAYFMRQAIVVGSLGALCAAFLFGLSAILYGDIPVSLVLAASLFAAVSSSLITGLLIPLLFSRFRADPANASGPVATIVQDIMSLVIYFLIAGAVL